MMHSIAMLAHNLKTRVIVEGIETLEWLPPIRDLGADEIPTGLLGKPLPDPHSVVLEQTRSQREIRIKFKGDASQATRQLFAIGLKLSSYRRHHISGFWIAAV